jgi:nucleotide-binding universal stress UspA family protein
MNPNGIVLVVGSDLSEASEHLLTEAVGLASLVPRADLHVVHVVHPESLRERLGEALHSAGPAAPAHREAAQWRLVRMCRNIVEKTPVRWFVHVRMGRVVDELARVAKDVGADFVVVQAHDRPFAHQIFRRSVVVRIARSAPCSVVTIREVDRTEGATRTARGGDRSHDVH